MKNATLKRRVSGEAREARDQEWLRLQRAGKSTSAIAEAAGVSVQLVRRALARLREQEASPTQDPAADAGPPMRDEGDGGEGPPPGPPAVRAPWWLELVPLFPIGAFTPASECRHRGPIRPGSLFCCMVCSQSGVDDHPAMKRDPATDPKPEPGPQADADPTSPTSRGGAAAAAAGVETRRERRARLFAAARRSGPPRLSTPGADDGDAGPPFVQPS